MITAKSSRKNLIELDKVFLNIKQVVGNFGVYFDTSLNFEYHVKKLHSKKNVLY